MFAKATGTTMLDAWFKSQTTTVVPVQRTPDEQLAVDARTAYMALYHYDSCMFCARVRKAIETLELNIALRDIMLDRTHLRELVDGGGRSTVPCLRIEQADGVVRWMYESSDIIRYLSAEFGQRASLS